MYNFIDKITRRVREELKDIINEETTADAISFLPSRVGMIKTLLRGYDDLDIEVWEREEHKEVNLGGNATITVPNDHWITFNNIFGGKLYVGKQKYSVPVEERKGMHLPTLRQEVRLRLAETLESTPIREIEEIIGYWRELFPDSKANTSNSLIFYENKDNHVEITLEEIMENVGDNRFELQELIGGFEEGRLENINFQHKPFFYGCRLSTKDFVFETAVGFNLLASQSIKVIEDEVLDNILENTRMRSVRDVIWPEGRLFTKENLDQIKDLLDSSILDELEEDERKEV